MRKEGGSMAYGGGGFNPLRDPVRNVALHTQILNTEYNRDKAAISDKERKAAYIGIIGLVGFLMGIVALFFIM